MLHAIITILIVFLMKSSTLKTVPYISERENILCGIVFGTHRDIIIFDRDIGHVE